MQENESEEVELDLEAEESPSNPLPENTNKQDDASQAFARLEGELAMMRRAVQHLATERADINIPDYTTTLGEMAGQLEQVTETLTAISGKPAIELTPEAVANQIKRASVDVQRENHELFEQARKKLDSTTGQLSALVGRVRTEAEQKRHTWHYAGAGLLAGILLWSILPGTVARAMPDNWHWPERMARTILGEASLWNAGIRMMQRADPQAWIALVDAADIQQDNRDKIEACKERASSSKRSVSCTVQIRAQTGSK